MGSGTRSAPLGAIDPASIADPGTITGSIAFTGEAPEAQVLQMAADPFCVTAAGGDVMSQRMVVNDNGTLSYVFVYVKGGLEGQTFTGASGALELAQTGCMYDPHMLGVQTGQTLTILNNDDTLHNVNASRQQPGLQLRPAGEGHDERPGLRFRGIHDPDEVRRASLDAGLRGRR